MICVKTGCHLHLRRRGLYYHGDLFTTTNITTEVSFFDRELGQRVDGFPCPELMLVLRYQSTPKKVTAYPYIHLSAEVENHLFRDLTLADVETGVLFLRGDECVYFGYGGMGLKSYLKWESQ